jgi:hypothetical protein
MKSMYQITQRTVSSVRHITQTSTLKEYLADMTSTEMWTLSITTSRCRFCAWEQRRHKTRSPFCKPEHKRQRKPSNDLFLIFLSLSLSLSLSVSFLCRSVNSFLTWKIINKLIDRVFEIYMDFFPVTFALFFFQIFRWPSSANKRDGSWLIAGH